MGNPMYPEIDRRFDYHIADGQQIDAMKRLRRMSKTLALEIVDSCGDLMEARLALRNLEQAMFYANAAIVRGDHADGQSAANFKLPNGTEL